MANSLRFSFGPNERSLAKGREHRVRLGATRFAVGALALVSSLAAGCGSKGEGNGFGNVNPVVDAGIDATIPTEDSGAIIVTPDSGVDASKPSTAEVFGQSGSTLYRLDPTTKNVTVVGDFAGCDSAVIDIALTEKGVLYGTTFGGLYAIDKTTAACTQIALGGFPNSLSFVPVGTLDANNEALVGFEGADYVRMNLTSGQKTIIKSGALGSKYVSSGDVVSVIGGSTYLTVTSQNCNGDAVCDACGGNDCLVTVDPKTGGILKNLGPLGFSAVYGIAFWAGKLYGFANSGALFEIDPTTQPVTTSRITVAGAPSDLSFNGAGSTTSAPIVPPK